MKCSSGPQSRTRPIPKLELGVGVWELESRPLRQVARRSCSSDLPDRGDYVAKDADSCAGAGGSRRVDDGLSARSDWRAKGEWRTYGGDLGTRATRPSIRSPGQFQQARSRLAFQDRQLGPRLEFNLQSTPLMVGGRLYSTGGTFAPSRSTRRRESFSGCTARRKARGPAAPRQLSGRGLAYWTDGKEERILRHARLPSGRAQCQDREPRPRLRQRRHRRSQGRPRSQHGPDRRPGSVCTPRRSLLVMWSSWALRSRPVPIREARATSRACAHSTCARASGCGCSRQSRSQARLGARRGRTTRGPTRGNTGVWAQISVDLELGMAYLPVEPRRTTTTVARVPATTCSRRAWLLSI